MSAGAEPLWTLVARRAEATPDALFAIDESDQTLTFAEYRAQAERAAAALQLRGIGADSPVSWILPSSLTSLVLIAALARLGARQNPILPMYRQREVGFMIAQSRARLLIAPDNWRGFDYAQMAREIVASHDDLQLMIIDDALDERAAAGLPKAPAPLEAPGDAPIRWLFYTSGTTAEPKGALHSDASLWSMARGMGDALDLAPDDRIAMVFPLTHIGGVGWLIAGLLYGCAQIVVPVFDAETTPATLSRLGVTQAAAGTVFHQAYLSAQRAHAGGPLFPSVRSFPGGGAPKPPQLHRDLVREMGGVGITSGYGLTECPIATMGSVRDSDAKLARTEGRPVAGMQVRIVRGDETPAATGETGEVRLRGDQLFAGYLDASLDPAAFDADGFLRSGDLGALDADGYLTITGRLKDVIIRKGENISAKEIEDLLQPHPSVAEVAVIGLPDPASGERCCAVIASEPGQGELTFAVMVEFLKQRELAIQKIPEQLEIVDALPRNATGKVLKDELRSRYTRRGSD